MKKIVIKDLQLWQFEKLSEAPGVRHFVTDRNSRTDENEFTLSLSSIPDKDKVMDNRRHLAAALGVSDNRLYFPRQVHETNIVMVTPHTTTEELSETDALITSEKGICIAVMSADCVPILLHDRKNKVVAAVHSGWRGTVARILEKTLRKMNSEFGTTGDTLHAGIGPSVSQESYEVGEEVVEAVNNTFGKESGLMIPQPDSKARLDLWQANRLQLLEFGVKDSNIEVSNLCTVKNNDHFFSARKGDTGRFAAGIMLI